MAKKDLIKIELTQTQAEKYSAQKIKAELVPRLSNRRCKTFLLQKIEAGIVEVPAPAIGIFTYKAIAVKGVDVGDVAGKKEPIRSFEKAAYEKLDAKAVAALVQEHTTEKRAAYIVTALLSEGKLKPSPAELVFLSNSRIAVEGVVIESTRKGLDISALVAGVQIRQPEADEAAA